jgi:hypothetical protein
MPLFARIRYSLYLAIALSMAVSLAIVLASADAIAVLPSSAFDWAFSPAMFLLAYAMSFVVAPSVSERFPIKRESTRSRSK